MARLTIGQKAERVLHLLMGLRKNKVAAALVAHGFSDDDLAEGWRLLQRLTRTRLGIVASGVTADANLITEIDEWENTWFPIAAATLKRRHPDVHAWMFRNLTQTDGPAVVVSVGTFVERWDQLAKPADKGGPEGNGGEAKKLLAKRGLTKDVIDEARQLLERAGKVESTADRPAAPADDEDFEQAEADLWAWYLEWSVIVQTAIKDRKILRELGFRRSTTTKTSAPEPEEEDAGDGDGEDEMVLRPRPTPAPSAKGRSGR
ncbi:hypothetical protein [Sorangium sp. So ce1024]|uniref:hypothetical protein n=1 Tax=Sorangium sp. So ce1024 TaxID=3133327 RepID=UPI003F025471